jgi:hypothetical protein
MLLLVSTAHAGEPRLSFHLRPVHAPLQLDDELPDVDLVLYPLPELGDEEDAPPTEPRWYGRSLMLADAASFGIFLAGTRSEAPGLVGVGLGGMILGGPIVHGLHGHLGRGGVGLLVRLGGFALGGMVGGLIGDSARDAGSALGYLGGAAFDGLYLCRDRVATVGWSGEF